MTTRIEISKISIDERLQNREKLDQNTIKEYAEALTDGATFPPVNLIFDGSNYWLVDGYHRWAAHRDIGALDISCEIKDGTFRDAILFSVGVNDKHGLRRSSADKKKAIAKLLLDDEWKHWSDREIARWCAVSPDTVGRARKEILTVRSDSDELDSDNKNTQKDSLSSDDSTNEHEQRTYKTKYGTTAVMNTENIGKQSKESKPNQQNKSSDNNDLDENQEEFEQISQLNEDLSNEIIAIEEENQKLRDAIAVGQLPAIEIQSAEETIAELRKEVKHLKINLQAVTDSRDSYIRENAVFKDQCKRQAAQLKKMGVKNNA